MTKQEKLEAIRAKVVEVIPEILELKFGCEIHVADNGVKRFYTGRNNEEAEMFFVELDQVGFEDNYFYTEGYEEDFNKKAIIGRPIRLADLLRAVFMNTQEGFCVEQDGCIWGNDGKVRSVFYDLTKDNLEYQSEDFINFYWDLIK